jgi:trehalose utilization protein
MKKSIVSLLLAALATLSVSAADIRVVVWDEQQPRQKQAYENYLGNAIAEHLKKQPGLSVKSVRLADPNKGMGTDVIDNCDVLIWWGHAKNSAVSLEESKPIVERIKAGKLSLIALHSSHWASPFMAAMNERTRTDAKKRYPQTRRQRKVTFEFVPPPGRFPPARDSIISPAHYAFKRGGVVTSVRVDLPNCCFPDYRNDGKPSQIETLKPDHPIAKGLPKTWAIPKSEMYNEPFHVPEPDEVVFKETWATGEWFRSGSVWNIGKGKVFYFRPGHETYPVFKQEEPLNVIVNAALWLGGELPKN